MKLKITEKIITLILILQTALVFSAPRISQVDNKGFALNTEINIYVNAGSNTKLKKENFKVYEKVNENGKRVWKQREITRFKRPGDIGKGINFVLLLDVSGSMAGRKIKSARNAIVSFIKSTGKHDSVKIITFGKRISETENFTDDKNAAIRSALNIKSPHSNAPTPLYHATDKALKSLAKRQGRKVIILLSDGVNDLRKDGYNDLSGFDDIPQTTLKQTITSARKTGIPVYSIGFECNTREMSIISARSGGKYYAYSKAEDLNNIYNEIRLNVLSEYLLSYKTDIGGKDIRNVRVKVNNANSNVRDYFAGSILGQKSPLNALLIIALLIAIALLILLYYINFTVRRKLSEISVLKGKPSAAKLSLSHESVIIGRNEKSSMGLFGDKTIANHHAKVHYQGGKYIIEQLDENFPVYVNKKHTKKAVLNDGSVIQLGNSLLVFNEKDEVE